MKYDYIIAGAGAAGLSLLHRILKDPKLQTKKILVLDQTQKVLNDRTWCFWEKKAGLFEEVVHHQWGTLEFLTADFERKFKLKEYRYKMIQGIDFYNHVLTFANSFENVTFKYENIQNINSDKEQTFVETEDNKYYSEFVFNSTSLFNPIINKENSLLQHFVGWTIKTNKPTFDPEVGTLMDFRLDQKNGTTFMYVLPTSKTEALVEYTLFSKEILEQGNYKLALEDYIKNHLKINSYEILHTEFGVIPMSLAKFERNKNREESIINIGTAGGFTKASSGYTFQFIQKNTQQIVDRLRKGQSPNLPKTMREKVYEWYDRTLIEVIISESMTGKEIFAILFKKLPMDLILKFLGNESTFIDDLKIMKTLPIKHFLKAGMKQIKQK
jgi:lycopene beta-cyclase